VSEKVIKKDTPVKDAALLVAITLVAAILLAFVHEITLEPIAAQQEKKKTEAYSAVYPELAGTLACEPLSKKAQSFLSEGGITIDEALFAVDAAGAPTGILMTVTSPAGYGGDITFTCGYTLEGRFTGIAFLSISETAGLGMKAQDIEFRGQFSDVATQSFALYKGSAKVIAGDTKVDAISNATITSKAVTNAVNSALKFAGEIAADGVEAYVNE
jgi:Na+-translocating ferredoxin:NAD+ oxidoreductase subunit G